MTRQLRCALLLTVACLAGAVAPAEAQWVYLGRKALGKVRGMTQSTPADGPRYSVATVMIEGRAPNVFAAAVKAVQTSAKARVTSSDPAAGTLEFTDGEHVVGLNVAQVGDEVVHLMVASVIAPGSTDSTARVVDATLRICAELKAQCSVLPQP